MILSLTFFLSRLPLFPSLSFLPYADKLASQGSLHLVKKAAIKAAEVRSVTSKSTDVTVTSAVALSKAQQEAISKAVPAYTGSGQSVAINYVVDPAVLGGLLVTFKNQTIDLSATTRLVEVAAASSQ